MLRTVYRYFFSATLVLFTFLLNAQPKIDSLQKFLTTQKDDSSKVKTLWLLSMYSRATSNEAAMNYGVEALNLARQLKQEKAVSKCYRLLGETYSMHGDFEHAIEMLQKGNEHAILAGDTLEMISSLNGIANAYQNSGNYDQSFLVNKKCLTLAKASNNRIFVASSLGNIGSTYLFLGEYSKALDNYLQARKIFEETKHFGGLSASYGNIALIHEYMGNNDKAMEYNKKSLEIDLKLGRADGMAATYGNMANLFSKQKQLDSAYFYRRKSLSHYQKANYELEATRELMNIYSLSYVIIDSLKKDHVKERNKDFVLLMDSIREIMPIFIKANDKVYGVILLMTLSNIQIKLKAYAKAEKNLQLGLQFAKETKEKKTECEFYEIFVTLYKKQKKFEKALAYQEKYDRAYKQMMTEQTASDISGKEMLFSFNKKVLADSLKNETDKKLKDEEIKNGQLKLAQEKIIEYALFGGLAVVLIFSILLFKRFKITSKQKSIIEEQKKLVERKQKEVLDSIEYAKRIQVAQIPTEKRIATLLNKLMK